MQVAMGNTNIPVRILASAYKSSKILQPFNLCSLRILERPSPCGRFPPFGVPFYTVTFVAQIKFRPDISTAVPDYG